MAKKKDTKKKKKKKVMAKTVAELTASVPKKEEGAIKHHTVKASPPKKKARDDDDGKGYKVNKPRRFKIKLKFLDEILGSKPVDPSMYLIHKIESTRASISEWSASKSKSKKALTFLDAAQITNEEVQQNLRSLRNTIEEYNGGKIQDHVWEDALANNLRKDDPLFIKIKENSGKTIFIRSEGVPCWEDYILKASFKDLASIFCERSGKKLGFLNSMSATVSAINRHLFIDVENKKERICYFYEDEACTKRKDIERDYEGNSIGNTRSLRANTPKGKISSLMTSEVVKAPCWVKFEVVTYLPEMDIDALKVILDVGERYGMSQWRNIGKGSFTYEIEEVTDEN